MVPTSWHGGVARSHSSFMAAWAKPYHGVTDPLVTETLAIRDGVIFAKLRGFPKLVMETDSLEIVNLWNTEQNNRSVVAPILLEIRELASVFMSFCIQHVSRAANQIAHLCAKSACTLSETSSWMNSPPDFLVASLLADDASV